MTEQTDAQIVDAFQNLVSQLGSTKDKSEFGTFTAERWLDSGELEALYEQSATHAMVVDSVVDDGTRGGYFGITGESESFDFSTVLSDMEDNGASEALADGQRWSRLYGGAIVVLNIDDGLPMDEPLNIDKAKSILGAHVIESRYAIPVEFNPGLGARGFRDPKFYNIFLPIGNKDKERKIHRSRVIRFDGVKVAPSRMLQNGGWGPSVLERPRRALQQLGEAMAYMRNIMHELSIPTIYLDGYREMMAGGAETKKQMREVLEKLKWNSDNNHNRTMDAKDKVEESTRSVAGIDNVIGRFVEQAVRDTGLARSKFTGEQPSGGLNNNGQTEIDVYHSKVRAAQDTVMTPALNRYLTIDFAIRAKTEKVPAEWSIEYTPLSLPDEKEQADTRKVNAEADAIYIAGDVMAADEVRARLINSGELVPLEGAVDGGES